MQTKLDRARSSDMFKVEESHLSCPKCDGKLFEIRDSWNHMCLMDGNSVFQCEIDGHRFWHHPRSASMDIHLNPEAREDNYDSDESFELIDGKWVSIKK